MIEKISIQNFRSIEDITIEPNNLTALIGPNSTGQANILKALNILLGETYPTERAFGKDDFFKRETDRVISIQVWFAEPLNTCRLTQVGVTGKRNCSPVSLKLTHSRQQDSDRRTDLRAFDLGGTEYYGSSEVRDQVSFVYIPSDRDLAKQMNVTEWTLLGKILKRMTVFQKERIRLRIEYG